MTQTATPNPIVNPKLIVPFMNAVRQVFKTMAGVETTVQRPFLKPQPGRHLRCLRHHRFFR